MTELAVALDGDPPRTPRKQGSWILGGISFTLFLASLALPAVQVGVLGHPSDAFPGWAAALLSVRMGAGALVEALSGKSTNLTVLGFLAVSVSALFNVILLSPLMGLRKRGLGSPSRRQLTAWTLGTALAIAAPSACDFGGLTTTVHVGYAVWLAAWLTLGAALLIARHEAVALTS